MEDFGRKDRVRVTCPNGTTGWITYDTKIIREVVCKQLELRGYKVVEPPAKYECHMGSGMVLGVYS